MGGGERYDGTIQGYLDRDSREENVLKAVKMARLPQFMKKIKFDSGNEKYLLRAYSDKKVRDTIVKEHGQTKYLNHLDFIKHQVELGDSPTNGSKV